MTILLDENFPLRLYRRLVARGYDVEHVIVSGARGISDTEIRRRLRDEHLLFLTNDKDFAMPTRGCRAVVVLSRVSQSRPVEERVGVWLAAIEAYLAAPPREQLLQVGDDGVLRPLVL